MNSPVITDLEAAWVAFVTEFEDGNIHAGHLVHGTDGFDLMIIHRTDGPPLIARDVEVEVELDGDPMNETTFPTRVRYTGDGQAWVWEAVEGGRCAVRADLPAGHRWRQGYVHLEGDDRPMACAEALIESYNSRLLETAKVTVLR